MICGPERTPVRSSAAANAARAASSAGAADVTPPLSNTCSDRRTLGGMGVARRTPPGGWSDGIETVPMRDHAETAPEGPRKTARIVRPDEPVPVRAWLRQRQSGEHLVDGEAIAWTDRQVELRYIDPHGRQGWAWLWASAVERR